MQGILIVDKPMEWTSFDVIAKLRGILGTRKLGHSGTLDPMATGVLPVFCSGASKAVDLQLDHTKTYCARLKLGLRTDTGDITGTVLETAPVTAGEAELLAVLPRFLGPQMQTPPMYSAVKINGQPLYKLAREGVTVERKARPIEILDIRYGGSPVENEYVLTVRCSKGTYIRTLLEDIAAAMGQKGTMSALRRTTAGVYTEADAHTLEEIQAAKDAGPEALQALMLPVESVFESLPSAGGGAEGGAASLQWLPHQPLSGGRWPLPRAQRRGTVPRACKDRRRRAQGRKTLRREKRKNIHADLFAACAACAGRCPRLCCGNGLF